MAHKALLVMFCLCAISGADRAYGFNSLGLYEATMDLCEELKALPPKVQDRWLNYKSTPSWKFNSEVFSSIAWSSASQALSEFRVLSLSSSAITVLEDKGFNKALEECFGSNQERKDQIRQVIDYADMRGKGFAGLGVVFSGYGTAAFLSRLAVVSPLAAKLTSGGLSGLGIYLSYSLYRQNGSINEQFDQSCGAQQKSSSECIDQGIQAYSSTLNNPQDSLPALMLILKEDLDEANSKLKNTLASDPSRQRLETEIHRLTQAIALTQKNLELHVN